jgi:alpha-tubulin suppressor-like RCC1 family protein
MYMYEINIAQNNDVYAFGSGKYGKLGLFDNCEDNVTVPRKIPSLVNIIEVYAAPFHSMALNCEGKLYTWGNAAEGKLGYDTLKNVYIPQKVGDNFMGTLGQNKIEPIKNILLADDIPIIQVAVLLFISAEIKTRHSLH